MSGSDVDDLLVRARRNLLSPAEKRELEPALDSLPEARLLLRAGLAFDEQASALAGDEELVSALARRAEEYSKARSRQSAPSPYAKTGARRRARGFSPWLTAAASLIIGGVAGVAIAATFWGIPFTSSAKEPSASAPRSAARTRSAQARVATPVARDPLPVASAAEPSMSTPAPSASPAGPVAYREPTARFRVTPAAEQESLADAPSAAQLYSGANQARVRGDLNAAIRGYQDLQLRYPSSAEATASRLTLGNVYLVSRQPELALAQFRAHQATGGAGFGVESLWGMALALRQLDRRAEEREALTLLLSRYPASTYEAAARRKLEERD